MAAERAANDEVNPEPGEALADTAQWLWQIPRHSFGLRFADAADMQKRRNGFRALMFVSCVWLACVATTMSQSRDTLWERARIYEPQFVQAGERYGVDPRLLWVVAYLESRFRPMVISPKGARGLMQFMPATAARYRLYDPHDATAAIDAAARYLRDLLVRYGQRVDLALAAYNAGEGAVDAALGKTPANGIPPYRETQNYVRRALLMLQGSAIPATRVANAVTGKNKEEVADEEDAAVSLPRGVTRQSLFIHADAVTASAAPPPKQRQSHYFGTRIDNPPVIPPANPTKQ